MLLGPEMCGFCKLARAQRMSLLQMLLVMFSSWSSTDGQGKVKGALSQQLDMTSELDFLRSKEHFPFHRHSVRPYSLSLSEGDYHYAPKPKHLRSARLMRLLGSSFDPFWMSVERPPNADEWIAEEPLGRNGQFNITASPELSEGATRYREKLEIEVKSLDFDSLPLDVATVIREWLVRSATCSLRYQWMDLGPVFWPRWLRHTDCYEAGGHQSCSFPSGMVCRQAQTTQVKILAWHCWGGDQANGWKDDGRSSKILPRKCLWRQVPYPVVTACKCSCK